jgi:CRISPR-associated protein Csm2
MVNRNSQGRNRSDYDRPKSQALPPVKIDGFYKDDKKSPKDELFSTIALNIANTFYVETEKYGVTKTQLRRLFDEVKRFEQNLVGQSKHWKNIILISSL